MKLNKSIFSVILFLLSTIALFSQVPQPKQDLVDRAVKSIQKGDLYSALEDLDSAIRTNPKNNYAYLLRGAIKILIGDIDAALLDTETAIRLAPSALGVEKAFNNRGLIWQFKRNSDRALADFEKAISINPNYAPPHNGRGVILEQKGLTDKALSAFERAIDLDPRGAAAYIGRGDIRLQRFELDLALSDFNKSLELHPDDPATYLRRGFVQGLRGRWEFAIADLRNGFRTARDPNSKYRGALSVIFSDLDKFIAQSPTNSKAFALRGFMNLFQMNDQQAQIDFDKSFVLDEKLRAELDDLITSVRERRAQ